MPKFIVETLQTFHECHIVEAENEEQAKKIAETKIREVVLTGVNIGDFGQGGDEDFYQLIQGLDEIDGIDRYRISSIEPNLLSNEIIDFCLSKSKHFVPHFHIPLQSGSDRILKLMRRKYERSLYAERVQQIKSLRSDACIGVVRRRPCVRPAQVLHAA